MNDVQLKRYRSDFLGVVSTVILTCLTVAMVYARNHRFFYRDDVEHQHMGVFTALHHNGYGINALGSFHKSWFLSLITGEVQFGVFNPVSRLRDFIAASGDNLAVAAALIALLYMLIAALGSYVAARALTASPAMSVAAALFVTFNVHLLYWDASSWTPALIGFSWFAWFVASIWWTRRNIRFAFLIPITGYLLVSAGWPHAMIAGGVVALVVGLEQLFTKNWKTREALIYAGACIAVALLSAPVWVSAQVFADWAARAPHGLFNDGFLTHQLDSIVLTFSPFVQPYVDGFAGQGFMFEPITYIAWFLPLAVYWVVTSPRVRSLVRVDIVIAGIVSVGMLGPSILGPTRWPFRFQPFAAFLVVMVAVRVLQASSSEGTSSTQRFTSAWKWIAPVVWLALTALRPRLIPMLLTAILFVAIAVAHRIYVEHGLRLFAPLLSASVVLTTAWLMYASPSPAMPGDRNAPSSRSAIADQYKVLEGHRVFVLQGDLAGAMTIEKKRGRFRLIPNLPTDITAAEMADGNIIQAANLNIEFVTGYSAMPHEGLENLFKTRVFGWSTSETAAALFAKDSTTKLPNYALLGIDAIMVQKGQQQTWFNAANDGNWKATYEQPAWTLFTRNIPPRIVTWHDTSLEVKHTSNKASIFTNTFGGKLVLARPITPGMKISVGGTPVSFSALSGAVPLVTVPANVTGDIVVTYSLPHQKFIFVLVLMGVVLVLALTWFIRQARLLTTASQSH